MSDVPKSQAPGVTRWELNTLKENRQDLSKNPIIAKLAQELIDSKEKAIAEGFAIGFEDGKKMGLSEGLAISRVEGQQRTTEVVNILSEIIFDLQKLFAYSKEHIAQEVVDLSIDLAKVIICRSIEKQPAIIVDVVAKALEQIPILQLPARILLHPQDAEIIEAHQGETLHHAGWRIVQDDTLRRGGCRLETGSHEVDATVEKRIDKMMAALGKESNTRPDSPA